MQLQTFKAPTMAECLTQVKTSMGGEAIILHTRTYQTKQWLGLRRREVVEITAGKGIKVGQRPRPGQQGGTGGRPGGGGAANAAPAGGPPSPRDRDDARAAGPIPGTYGRPGSGGAVVAAKPAEPRSLLDTPAATNAVMLNLTSEVTTLKKMMTDLLAVTRHKQAPQVPEELFGLYEQLTANRVDEDLAADVVKAVQRQVRAEHYGNASYMRDRLIEQVERMLPVGGPIARTKKVGPHVVALIGPTGVGKTTTIAKLAANLKLRDKHRVGLITLDTYRIAAVDQLRRYAEIIGAPLKVVASAEELTAALKSMADLEYVLIDTAGRSPNDKLKLNELKKVLDSAQPDEVHLVVSTTASEECLELAVNQFGEVRVDKVIFTKLDEAARLGVLLNVTRRVNRTLSYVTTGQDVPNDIEVGQTRRLAQLVLGDGL